MKKLDASKIILGMTAIALFSSAFIGLSNTALESLANFNFSNGNEPIVLKPSEVIEKLTGDTVTDLEKNYINGFSKYELSYQKNPNIDKITLASFDNDLYVLAQKYTYTDSSNRKLTWVPKTFEYKGITYNFELSDDAYKSKISTYDSTNTQIKVNYALDIELDKNLSNELINKTYYLSKDYSDERDEINSYNKQKSDEYAQAYAKYELDHQQYLDDYAQYLLDYAAWEKNEENILTYDSRKVKYDAYQVYLQDLQKYNDYLQAVEDYNNHWAAYNKYVTDKQAYDANKVKYDKYVKSKARIDFCLNAMNIFYQQMPFTIDGQETTRSIYDAVLGGTVTEVLNNKSDIVSAGVEAEAVDKAGVATTGLRNVMNAYKALQTESEKYSYYHDYYNSDILVHSENLLRCLEYFLRNNLVYSFLNTKGKLYKYQILVAQLMYVCNVLDTADIKNYEYNKGSSSSANAYILNESTKIDGKTYKQILGSSASMETNNDMAYPYYVTVPEVVEPLPEPIYVEKPGAAPQVVEEPAEVAYAEDPGVKPVHYDCPTFTKTDAIKPLQPTLKEFDESKVALADAYNTTLLYRNEFSSNPVVTFTDNYECDFSNQLLHVARFYDNDGVLIKEQFFKKSLTYEGKLPTKPGDAIYSDYDFDKWVDKNGNIIDMDNIDYSLCLYPTFVGGNYNYYNITWIIPNNNQGQETIVTSCRADELPTPPYEVPTRTDYQDYYYEFDSWDKPLLPVTGEETYTALFEEKHYYVCLVSNFDDLGTKINKQFKSKEEMETYISTINPSKKDTNNNYFIYNGWIINQNGDFYFEYIADFTKESFLYVYYDINGVSYRQDHKYKKGDTILPWSGSEPTKPDSGNEKYTFAGWDYDFTIPIYSTTHITALFDIHYYYTVTFVSRGEILSLATYEEGSIVVEPPSGGLTYYENGCFYTFKCWDKQITEVSEDIVYTALFEAVPVVTDAVSRQTLSINVTKSQITIYCKSYRVINIQLLMELIYSGLINQTEILFVFDDCTITINATNVGYLSRKFISCLTVSYNFNADNTYEFVFSLLDSENQIFDDELVYASICIFGNFNDGRINVTENGGKKPYTLSSQDTLNIDSVKLNIIYSVIPYYEISVIGGSEAQITLSANTAAYGQIVSVTVEVREGYRFNGGYIQYGTTRVDLVDGQFVMPASDVTVILNVEHIVYHIIFMVEGNVYCDAYGYYGETIEFPLDPTKLSDENYNYVFVGWDKTGDVFTQNDTYTAIFKANEIVKTKVNSKIGIIQIGIISLSSVAVVGVGTFLFLRIRKKRKLKKK